MTLPPDSVLLDTAWPDAAGTATGPLLFTDPERVLTAHTLSEVPPLLAELDRATAAGEWVAGYLAYEAGYAFERVAEIASQPGPLAWFGVYRAPQRLATAEVERLLDGAGTYSLTEPQFALDRAAYRDRIARIKAHIRAGDVYQINFTAPFRFGFEGDPVGLYRTLRQRQRVGYGALVRTEETWVLSRSPELFFSRNGLDIAARPMKGTARRGATGEEDAAQARWLTDDAKNRAENLMIVDLLRNDLSVVAEPGSVRVPALFTAERYDTLWQMTSTVEARLRPGVGLAEIVRALFPCGSVTGAPKIRAMQLIDELEGELRGVYCGAVGFAGPNSRAVFNVPIRTVVLRDGEGRMGSGSGVVWDSDADAEYDECVLKARFLTAPPLPDFALLETMRWDGGCALLDRHLDRLRRSAAYFGFPFDESLIRERLTADTADLRPDIAYRLRLTFDQSGRVNIEAAHLAAAPLPLRNAVVFAESVDAADPFLRHKTTHRPLYDRAFAWAQERGFDEALLLNECGEVTEGTRTNVFVRRGGRLLTPPLASGGLDGVFRAHVLATRPGATEHKLHAADLFDADAVYLCNALRGWHEVTVAAVPEP
ncbi:MAG: aminodeoxychorismate synthase component I [Rhodothermales bacterium]